MKITKKQIRPSSKPQTTTTFGIAGACTQFLSVFGKVEISNLIEEILKMNCQEAFTAFAPFFLFGYAIFFNEDGPKNDKDVKSIKEENND